MKSICKGSIERNKLRELFQSITPEMFYKGKDGKEYLSITAFHNPDEPDKYGNTMAICFDYKSGDKYDKKYLANLKPLQKRDDSPQQQQPAKQEQQEINQEFKSNVEDLPF